MVFGVGVLAIVTGTIWFTIDEDPVTQRGVDVPREYRDTGTQGVITGLAGVVVAGFGGIWWRRAGRTSATPSDSPAAGSAVLGLSKSF